MATLICKTCHKAFTLAPAHVRHRVHCSNSCRYKGVKLEKVCSICGNFYKVYKKEFSRSKACSRACANKLRMHRKHCALCNKEYFAHRKAQVYCSVECANKAKIKLVSMVCIWCRKKFVVKRRERKRHKFCSHKCYADSIRKHKRLSKDQLEHLLKYKSMRDIGILLDIPHTNINNWTRFYGMKVPKKKIKDTTKDRPIKRIFERNGVEKPSGYIGENYGV